MMENNKKEIQEELEKLAPSLSKLKKEEHFEVPENYFNQLPDQILSQINFSKNKTQEVVAPSKSWLEATVEKLSFFFQPRVAVSFAMGLILLGSVYFFTKNTETITPQFAELNEEEMYDYLKANLNELEENQMYDFVDEMAANDFEEVELEEFMEEIIDDLDESELEEFL